MSLLRVGVDCGGTNTDCVVVQGERIVAHCKSPTLRRVGAGVRRSLHTALQGLPSPRPPISHLMLGTTHFVNAMLQGVDLQRVAVLRLGGHATQSLPPLADWPPHLAHLVNGAVFSIRGGYEFDGRELAPLDEDAIVQACTEIRELGIQSVVISCVFSTVCSEQVECASKIVRRELGGDGRTLYLSTCTELGRLGLIERENATIINGCLRALADETISSLEKELQELDGQERGQEETPEIQLYLTQNDGTLMPMAVARELPVLTFASGTTNSMRGAAFLTGYRDAIVMDIGGTSTDVGLIRKGFPVERALDAQVGGVRTNFRLPDVHSIGLGGGSRVRINEEDGSITIGPDSVGCHLREDAIVFGGSTLTTTDIAVAAGLCEIGDPSLILHGPLAPSKEVIKKCLDQITLMLGEIVEKVVPPPSSTGEKLPLLLVGGGQVLVSKEVQFPGIAEIIRPKYSGVVNAFGAAIGQVSVERELALLMLPGQRDNVVRELQNKLTEELLASNPSLKKEAVEMVELQEIPIPYMQDRYRLRMKLVGDIQWGDSEVVVDLLGEATEEKECETSRAETENPSAEEEVVDTSLASDYQLPASDLEVLEADPHSEDIAPSLDAPIGVEDCASVEILMKMFPLTFDEDGSWLIRKQDLAFISFGCALLGSGGGGATHGSFVRGCHALEQGKKIRVVPVRSLPEDSLVVPVAFLGAPSVLNEKIASGKEFQCVENLERTDLRRISEAASGGKFSLQGTIRAVMSAEIGGMNGMEPLLVSAETGFPVVDADGMGRAFPQLDHFLPYVYGVPGLPCTIANHQGDSVMVTKAASSRILEDILRVNSINFGCVGGLTMCPLSMETIRAHCVQNSVSLAWRLGAAMHVVRHTPSLDPMRALPAMVQGQILYSGKICSLERRVEKGFSVGRILVGPIQPVVSGQQSHDSPSEEPLMRVTFRNENILVERVCCPEQMNTPVEELTALEQCACVPNIISVLETESGFPIACEELSFGQRVSLLVQPGPLQYHTEQAMKIIGPRAFGLHCEYQPTCSTGSYVQGPSVFDDTA